MIVASVPMEVFELVNHFSLAPTDDLGVDDDPLALLAGSPRSPSGPERTIRSLRSQQIASVRLLALVAQFGATE